MNKGYHITQRLYGNTYKIRNMTQLMSWDDIIKRTRSSAVMSPIWIQTVLTFSCCISFTFSTHELTNVAYSKTVTLSSLLHSGSKAVNGLFNDFAHTHMEKSPWLRIDLGARHRIHEIEIFARSDGYGSQLHDFDVKVGDEVHDMHLCGHFTGAASNGQRIAIWCPHDTVGRHVQLQIVSGNANWMTPAEVLVWGVHVY